MTMDCSPCRTPTWWGANIHDNWGSILSPSAKPTKILSIMVILSTGLGTPVSTATGGPVPVPYSEPIQRFTRIWEAIADVSESLPVFEPVGFDPGSLAALIPLSQEIVQDSPNLDAALQAAIAGAFALKLDQLSIAKILADTALS
jgi:hypothetical protein